METTKETYFGVEIVDDYRNFENLKDTTVLNWIKIESNKTAKVFENVKGREDFRNKIIKNYDSRKYRYKNTIHTSNGNVFYVKYSTEDYIDKIYFKNNKSNNEELVFDVSKISPNHSISYMKINNQNTLLAFAVSEEGKELSDIYIYDINKNKILDKIIDHNWVKSIGGIQWLENGEGFYYTRLQSKDITTKDFLLNNKTVLYLIKDSIHKFEEVFSQNSENIINPKNNDLYILKKISKNYVFGEINGVNKHKSVYFAKKNINQNYSFSWQKFYSESDLITNFEIQGNDIYYLSDLNNQNVISKTSFDKLEFKNQNIIVKAPKDETITKMVFTSKNKYFTTIKNGVQAFLYKFEDKNFNKIELPFDAGSFYDIYPKTNNSQDLIIDFSGWTKNYIRYIYKSKENKFIEENIEEKQILVGINDIRVDEIEIKTHDGLDLPVSIIYNKNLIKNGKNKTIITAYGAYGYNLEPAFNVYDLLWVVDGGIYVIAHVRGGGNKGDSWYKGGFKATKSNSWKDVISTTEYLIKEGYTLPEFIGLTGTSAGGITISNAALERPDLFKAVNIENASLNNIRSETDSAGMVNAKEYGSITNKEEFPHLLNMDAYHKIKPNVKYPTMLISAGLNDARVPAWHSAKFVAKLKQHNQKVYLDLDFESGHFSPNSFNAYTFFYWQLGHPDYQLKE